jgi:tripartite-type tricarboxylate transporter receptor subunit TctC
MKTLFQRRGSTYRAGTVALATGLSFALAFATAAAQAAYPDRAIRWVVPFPAGGAIDNIARTLGDDMSRTRRTKGSWVFRNLCDDGELAWRILSRGTAVVSIAPTTILLLIREPGRAPSASPWPHELIPLRWRTG